MPQPTTNSIIVRGALQNVSVAFKNDNYIADRVFPIIDGVTRQAKVGKYLPDSWFRDEAKVRAPGAEAAMTGFELTTSNLDPVNYAIKTDVPKEYEEEAAVASNIPVRPEVDAIEYCADKIDLSKEIRTAAIIMDTTWADENGSGGEDVAGLWADTTAAGNTFFADIQKGMNAIHKATGLMPNKLVMDSSTFNSLRFNPQIQTRLGTFLNIAPQTGTPAPLNAQVLAALAGVEEVLIGSAIKVTDNETKTKSSTISNGQYVWEYNSGKGSAFLYYHPSRPGLRQVSAGYQYRVLQSGVPRLVTSWWENKNRATMYQVDENVDISPMVTGAGYAFKDTIQS